MKVLRKTNYMRAAIALLCEDKGITAEQIVNKANGIEETKAKKKTEDKGITAEQIVNKANGLEETKAKKKTKKED